MTVNLLKETYESVFNFIYLLIHSSCMVDVSEIISECCIRKPVFLAA